MNLSLRSQVIGSAHRLSERNISVKFNEINICSKGSVDMERTRNSSVNSLTCDLDLESR